jgi:hypothetical protein
MALRDSDFQVRLAAFRVLTGLGKRPKLPSEDISTGLWHSEIPVQLQTMRLMRASSFRSPEKHWNQLFGLAMNREAFVAVRVEAIHTMGSLRQIVVGSPKVGPAVMLVSLA